MRRTTSIDDRQFAARVRAEEPETLPAVVHAYLGQILGPMVVRAWIKIKAILCSVRFETILDQLADFSAVKLHLDGRSKRL